MNRITTRKSRYLTLSEAIHRAGPIQAKKASATKTGSARICQPGANPVPGHDGEQKDLVIGPGRGAVPES
jgi:hypothetical protein